MVLQDGQQVISILTGARLWDVLGLEALFHENSSLGLVEVVDAFNDPGLNCSAAVLRRQVGLLDARPLVEPLTAQVVVPGEVGLRLWPNRWVTAGLCVVDISSSGIMVCGTSFSDVEGQRDSVEFRGQRPEAASVSFVVGFAQLGSAMGLSG